MTSKTLEERVQTVEEAVIVLVETKGMIRLTAPTLALVWAVFIVLLSLAGTGAVTVFQQRTLAEAVRVQGVAILHITERLDAHVASDGHPVMLERVAGMKGALDGMKNAVDEVRRIVSQNQATLSHVKQQKP